MNQLAIQRLQCVPNTIQNAVRYTAAYQWEPWVQKHLTVVALEQLRRLGSKAAVGFLVNALAPGVITAEGYARLAFALKSGVSLGHCLFERVTPAHHIEVVQETAGTLADVKLEDHPPRQTLEKIGLEEWRNLVKLFTGGN